MPGGRCIVLNASYEFLHVTNSWWDSLRLLRRDKVVALAHYPTPARSEKEHIRIPAVVVLKQYVATPRKTHSFTAGTLRTVLIRDKFACQYCGCKLSMKSGTKDHVLPSSRGGSDNLSNLVAACKSCNNKKSDRTPGEAGMKLLSKPRALSEDEKMEMLVKVHKSTERNLWKHCLEELKVKLF